MSDFAELDSFFDELDEASRFLDPPHVDDDTRLSELSEIAELQRRKRKTSDASSLSRIIETGLTPRKLKSFELENEPESTLSAKLERRLAGMDQRPADEEEGTLSARIERWGGVEKAKDREPGAASPISARLRNCPKPAGFRKADTFSDLIDKRGPVRPMRRSTIPPAPGRPRLNPRKRAAPRPPDPKGDRDGGKPTAGPRQEPPPPPKLRLQPPQLPPRPKAPGRAAIPPPQRPPPPPQDAPAPTPDREADTAIELPSYIEFRPIDRGRRAKET